jgi:hypothetical protein
LRSNRSISLSASHKIRHVVIRRLSTERFGWADTIGFALEDRDGATFGPMPNHRLEADDAIR